MNNPAFIVDGYTELKIVQQLCPGRPIKRTDCNGKDVSISVMAKKIASHIRLLNNRYYPIIILVDKENRNIEHEEMVEQIREELVREGVTTQDLRIGVADRMIENWILGDWEVLNGGNSDRPTKTDGCNGTSIIKKVKKSYDKTTDGVDYFIAAKQSSIYVNSPSYKHFIDQLSDIACQYLEFDK
ncbi:DUF4276 family protein [Chitinophaga ginsengisoli]|uniref:Uncharacterized protein DUF4276 n=1 Tax=Chitinophaga ginsengisoli TaxID=363837 RepID=A0A2P8G2X4_9BACT|nr:DUF4276 family protein [Chitinophaga ginsengisoli]PSL28344.1 uncharacterized protein DUF4276 [Chitinophaga ginsengisoli]